MNGRWDEGEKPTQKQTDSDGQLDTDELSNYTKNKWVVLTDTNSCCY